MAWVVSHTGCSVVGGKRTENSHAPTTSWTSAVVMKAAPTADTNAQRSDSRATAGRRMPPRKRAAPGNSARKPSITR